MAQTVVEIAVSRRKSIAVLEADIQSLESQISATDMLGAKQALGAVVKVKRARLAKLKDELGSLEALIAANDKQQSLKMPKR